MFSVLLFVSQSFNAQSVSSFTSFRKEITKLVPSTLHKVFTTSSRSEFLRCRTTTEQRDQSDLDSEFSTSRHGRKSQLRLDDAAEWQTTIAAHTRESWYCLMWIFHFAFFPSCASFAQSNVTCCPNKHRETAAAAASSPKIISCCCALFDSHSWV